MHTTKKEVQMFNKKLENKHIGRTVFASVKGQFSVTGVLVGIEYLEREEPREKRHPLMGSVAVKGVELHIGNKVYFVSENEQDACIMFL